MAILSRGVAYCGDIEAVQAVEVVRESSQYYCMQCSPTLVIRNEVRILTIACDGHCYPCTILYCRGTVHATSNIQSSPRPNPNFSVGLHQFHCRPAVNPTNVVFLTTSSTGSRGTSRWDCVILLY